MEKKKNNSKTTKKSSSNKSANVSTKKTTAAIKNSKNVSAKKSTEDLKKLREEEKPKVDLIKVNNTSNEKSIKNFEFMKFVLYAIGIFIIAIGILFNNNLVEKEIFGIVLGDIVIPIKLLGYLIIGATGVVQCVRTKKESLIKSATVILAMAILGAWLFPNGSISGASFTDSGTAGISLNDLVSIAYNGVYMCIDKLMMIVSIALFYKIAEATGAYHKIVDTIVKPLKGKGKNVAIAIGAIVITLISFVTEIFAILFFIPLFISILSKLKVDKMTSFAVTFGALMIGAIGSPYGTESLTGFNYYSSISMDESLLYRIILQLCIVVLFVIFVTLRMKETSNEEIVEEQLLTQLEYKKINSTPLMVLMFITAFFMTFGFIDFATNFEITIFQDLYDYIFDLSIGDFYPFVLLFGSSASVIGSFTLFDGISTLIIISVLMILAYKIEVDKIYEIIISTLKFVTKPLLLVVIITAVFTVGYMTQFLASVGYYVMSFTPEFNPYTSAFMAGLSSVFHSDLAFTAYLYSSYFSSNYSGVTDILSITYTSVSALVQIIIPTSPLLIGLYYTKVPYKEWIKYIGLFFAGISIVILILLTVITYLG